MKKLLTFVLTMLVGASLAFAQAGGGSSGTAATGTTADTGKKPASGKKATKTKKSHKGGKKSKKGSSDTTAVPK